ncbi:MAG: hypothetical protein OK438_06360 [Thaumarchaeota archaeon]|nr:hypothetical protein [Nitrososphaerota archaeon]
MPCGWSFTVVSLVYGLATIGEYTYNQTFYTLGCPGRGAVGCDFNWFIGPLVLGFLLAIGYYFLVRWYRSKGGIPYDMTFKEIPPE